MESFLKGVRSQVDTSKVKEEEAEKEKDMVEKDNKGVVEEGNEVVLKEDMVVTLMKESIGDVATVMDIGEGERDENQGGVGGGEQE